MAFSAGFRGARKQQPVISGEGTSAKLATAKLQDQSEDVYERAGRRVVGQPSVAGGLKEVMLVIANRGKQDDDERTLDAHLPMVWQLFY